MLLLGFNSYQDNGSVLKILVYKRFDLLHGSLARRLSWQIQLLLRLLNLFIVFKLTKNSVNTYPLIVQIHGKPLTPCLSQFGKKLSK